MISILAVILTLVVGAVLSIVFTRHSRLASWLGAIVAVVSCGWGAWSSVRALASGTSQALTIGWLLPNAALSFGLDPLSAFFLIPLFLLGGVAACYGRAYLIEHSPKRIQSVPWAAFNLMLAAMALVVVARHVLLFLVAWEAMSLAAFLLIAFDHHDAAVRRASFVYLIATHVGVAALLALFLRLGSYSHSFEFSTIAATPVPSKAIASLLFLLALVGFGAKAGIFPLHVWLPEAHASAPTHVSALMSGILIKMGIYGILRVVLLLGGPRPFWGQFLMILGIAGGLVGIGCALYQRDIKRLLAYSSVENIGLIVLGLGTAFWGMTSNRPQVTALAMLGGLLHIWNHASMKGLMFLGAGSVVHRCHGKDIEQLGGLYHRMPRTALALLIGATAMAGLPPLNGFVSEWFMYSGLLHAVLATEGGVLVAVVAVVAGVSLIGAMAALCFCRLIGIAMLGNPRSAKAEAAKEASHWMVAPMTLLVLINVTLALSPLTFTRLFEPVVSQLSGHPLVSTSSQLQLSQIGAVNRGLFGVLIGGVGLAVFAQAKKRLRAFETWGCGYSSTTGRVQYTGRGFSQLFTSNILPRFVGPQQTVQRPTDFFATTSRMASEIVDPLTRGVYEPFLRNWANRFVRLRIMQQGILHIYVLYILVALLLALTWSAICSFGGFS